MTAGPRVRFTCEAPLEDFTAARVRRAVEAAWALYGGPGEARVEVVLLGAKEHTRLHGEFLDDPTETDVMAFPYNDSDLCGEVLVNRDVALREASARGTAASDEALLYVVHGVLHLLGMRDGSEREREEMRAAEARVLASCGEDAAAASRRDDAARDD